MGHGGTLDPMATGVLIVGIGRGTKSLQDFLYCTKTYETVVLFGKSTDTYDVAGKIVASAATSHITKQLVEEKLAMFRGKIKQVPPIYSALKINGVKAYEYARSGKPLPRELEARDMEVSECSLIDWYEPGEHAYRWPIEEAAEEDKHAFQRLARAGKDDVDQESEPPKVEADKVTSSGEEVGTASTPSREQKAASHTHTISGLSEAVADAPAARFRLTVSSGFYVRSFAHDIGLVCDSYATMAELARTRQADFAVRDSLAKDLKPALEYGDIEKGEDVWGPQLSRVLDNWLGENPDTKSAPGRQSKSPHSNNKKNDWRGRKENRRDDREPLPKRRNSSSPE